MTQRLITPFHEEIARVAGFESKSVDLLLRLQGAAQSPELKKALERFVEQGRNQLQRVQSLHDEPADGLEASASRAAVGLIEDTDAAVKEYLDAPCLDAVVVLHLQQLFHALIATYGTLCSWAKELEREDALADLKARLSEVKGADELLLRLAQDVLNDLAVSGGKSPLA